jgi:1,4-dihydroxy-6-naphthoate synthase
MMGSSQRVSSSGDEGGVEGVLRFGHSPDPDDAFMFYGFSEGGVHVEVPAPEGVRRWKVEHVLEDIQSLNERAMTGELEITAISAHTFPYVSDKYWVMRTGVSMGDGYGPIVVARSPIALQELRGRRVAIPGAMTTATLVLKLFLPEFQPVPMKFDRVLEAVRDGEVDAGVIIHEGQLTFGEAGLELVADLGILWREESGLPLPLGLDVVRQDLGEDLAAAASRALRDSIAYARAHPAEAMAYALRYGRGLDLASGTRFVDMYVNDWTLDLGTEGIRALSTLLDRGSEAGLIPRIQDLKVV